MRTDNTSTIDARVMRSLSGGEKLSLLLSKQAGSVAKWAIENRINSTEVYYTLSGARPYPRIRAKIARSVGLEREEVDRLIDGESAPAEATA